MRHSIYFANSNMYFIIFILVILAVAIIVRFRKNSSNMESEKLNSSEKKVMDNFDSLVISMLNQNDGGLMQSEISTNLNLSLDLVSKELMRMENEKIIKREWINEQYTYKISIIK